MKTTMYAIIKKDFRGLAANRRGRKIFCVYGEKSSLIRTRYV